MKHTIIDQGTLAHLSAATCHGEELRLSSTLDRGVYAKVKKVIEAAGGKWNRGAAAHIFTGGAAEAIEPILMTGSIIRPQDMGQFDSPPAVVAKVIEMANIREGDFTLEPSAGVGMLARAAHDKGAIVRCVEIDEGRVRLLRSLGYPTRHADFLSLDLKMTVKTSTVPLRFDRIVMNPPFAKQADIDHVLHAAEFLKPGGRLVSVMSAGFTFRQDRKASGFRMFLDTVTFNGRVGAVMEYLPDGAFKIAGTSVKTVVIAFDKAAA